ncbi:MAG: DUF1080 domain-containing protein [Planctomycetes bacterium]|nr:DUF1080 domain-containing protein [Planctomycetota bacterium]
MPRLAVVTITNVFACLMLSLSGPAATSATDEDTKSALESQPDGWIDILPPSDLKGWTRVPIPAGGKPGEKQQWHVASDSRFLICDGDGGHEWLRYDRELGDCTFHVEWRFTRVEGKKGYNSGVYTRNSADGKIWHQAQVGSASGGFFFGDTPVMGEIKRINVSKDLKGQRVKEAGEWNTFELTARGKTLTLWVNGAVTSVFSECEATRGHIGLEAEGWRIEFRNTKLKELR